MNDNSNHIYPQSKPWDSVSGTTKDLWSLVKEVHSFYKSYVEVETKYCKRVKVANENGASSLVSRVRGKKESREEPEGALAEIWRETQEHVGECASKHEEIAANVNENVVIPMTAFLKKKEPEMKMLIGSGERSSKTFENALVALDIARSKYHQACVDEKKNDVAKAQERREAAEEGYRKAIDRANSLQAEYFDHSLPQFIQGLEKLNKEFIEYLKNVMMAFVDSLEQLPSALRMHVEAMEKSLKNYSPLENNTREITTPTKIESIQFEEYVEGDDTGGGGWRNLLKRK